jgi:hypothetical protein
VRRRRTGTWTLSCAILLACATGVAPAQGAGEEIAITSPASESASSDPMPLFVGALELQPGEEPFAPVAVSIHEGPSLLGPEVAHAETPPFPGTSWFVRPTAELPEGTYTVQASEQNYEEPLLSAPVTFREDRTPPAVAIGAPASGASLAPGPVAVSGSAGTAAGDGPTVTVDVYAGAGTAGPPIEGLELQSGSGAWSGALAGLGAGSYTLQAVQTDTAGNVGYSPPVSVTVGSPALAPPPKASFTWVPAHPQAGEQVTLVSSSTDASSPLAGFAWSLASNDPFRGSGPTLETSFALPGAHAVRLQVTAADGQANTASETIPVLARSATMMQPFPIVRIAGRETSRGVRLSLLTVTAPVSSHITVRTRGAGSRSTSVSRLATAGARSGGGATTVLAFPAFERALPAGTVLEVRVTKAGQIGKLTRFTPHVGKLPSRSDSCLAATGKPIKCPTS